MADKTCLIIRRRRIDPSASLHSARARGREQGRRLKENRIVLASYVETIYAVFGSETSREEANK